MNKTFLGALALSACLTAAAQAAAPRTINDCEKIEAPDAYNQCLALFGPPAHKGALNAQDGAEGRSAQQVEPLETKPALEAAEPETPAKHGRHASRHFSRHYYHHGNGRHYAHHWRHRHSAFWTSPPNHAEPGLYFIKEAQILNGFAS